MSKLYRPCVGLIIINHDKRVFVAERLDSPGNDWQMPQGGIDPGESVEDALWRELYEETGTGKNNAELIRIAPRTIRYDLPEHLQKKLWGGKYAGQEQTWAALRFTGQDSDINLEAHNPPEFRAWKWAHLHDTPDLIIPFKRETYNKVVAMFEDLVA